MSHHKVIIIGSGPAGHTAAIYAGRANLDPIMFEGWMAGGVAAGGQLTTTTSVENFPGFPGGIQGPELMLKMREQSLESGTTIYTKTVDRIDVSKRPFRIWSGQDEYSADTVIIATGATAKRLDVPGADTYWMKGISGCAICDGSLPLFRNKVIGVVGGGDVAMEEAIHMSHFGSKVLIFVRTSKLRASKAMEEKAMKNPKIEFVWNTEITHIHGEKYINSVTTINNQTQEVSRIELGGLFFAIGHVPNTAFLGGQIQTDETGYIITKPGTTQTSVPGVFAAGDVQDKKYRQAITSAGTGCMAALEAEKFLQN